MVHHQAMSLLALSYPLLDQPMQKTLSRRPTISDGVVAAPGTGAENNGLLFSASDKEKFRTSRPTPRQGSSLIPTADTPLPEVQLLSNGKYHVMVTNAGGGYSRWNDIAVTRWREDGTSDNRGSFCYLRNLDRDGPWSVAFQPTQKLPSGYEVVFFSRAR